MSNDSYMDLNKLVEALEHHHKMAINQIPKPKPTLSPPKSIKKELITSQQRYNRLLKIAATNPKEATAVEIEGVENAITELIELTKDDQGTEELAEKLEVDKQTLQESIISIEDWVGKAANIYRDTEAKAIAQNIIFQDCPKSGKSSTENLSIQNDLDKEYSVKGLILNQRPSSINNKDAKIAQESVKDIASRLQNTNITREQTAGESNLAETPRRPHFGGDGITKLRKPSKSRSRSRERKQDGKQSPTASVGSSMRGGSKTHTMLISLERAMGLLKSVEPNFRSTTFKRYYSSTTDFKMILRILLIQHTPKT